MKKSLGVSFRKMKHQWNCKNYIQLVFCALIAILLNFIVELLARRSFSETFQFIFHSPVAFFYSTLIILFTMSFSLFLRKRDFWFMFICAVWLGLAITDFILLNHRSMPLTASDIWLMSSVRGIFEKYLSHTELFLLMVGVSALLCVVFIIWKCAKKHPMIHWFAAFHVMILGLILLLATLYSYSAGIIEEPRDFDSLPRAYRDNGFVYSFSTSLITGGVPEPDGYSEESVLQVISKQNSIPKTVADTPNIIFVQLESFFDPAYLQALSIEENPIPNFSALKETYSSGFLSVPCIGAGTANTEFEVLTGMNLAHFGVGEYPYMTIADSAPIESVATALHNIGYRTHAVHNYAATFYDRDVVYSNFGFDTFTSIEYMDGIEYNPIGWAKDDILVDEVLKSLNCTDEKDLVFSVSVQPHGKYPVAPIEEAPIIPISGWEDEERKNRFEYYLGQLQECDAFVGRLTDVLADFEEPTVVVFYGDHLPSFNIAQEELGDGSTQTTEYVLWANFPMSRKTKNLQTYQLAAYVMERCGIHEGPVFRHHQLYHYSEEDDLSYQDSLVMLEYDLVYGEKYAAPVHETGIIRTLLFDVEEISISNVVLSDPEEFAYLVYGEHFTPYSRVMINGEILKTEYISPELLLIGEVSLEPGSVVSVVQVSAIDELDVLSECTPFMIPDLEVDLDE